MLPAAWLALVVLAAGAAAVLVVLVVRPPDVGGTTGAAGEDADAAGDCDATETLSVVADPAVVEAVRGLVAAAASSDPCVTLEVSGQSPAAAIDAAGPDGAGVPDVWIPDSSLWAERLAAQGVGVEAVGGLGQSPLAVVTSRAAAEDLGWQEQAPSWAEALTTGRGLAVGDLRQHAASVMALAAAQRDVEGPEAAGQVAAAASLSQQRAPVDSVADGLAALASDAGADIVVASATEILASGAVQADGDLVAIQPQSTVAPVLDYPVLRLARPQGLSPAATSVLDGLVAELTAAAVVDPAAAAGLGIQAPPGEAVLASLPAEESTQLVATLEVLAVPSQLLVVVDVSTSMLNPVPDTGGNRADVASQALLGALALLPDRSRVGLWNFAADLDGDRDFVEVSGVEQLDSPAGDGTHRDELEQALQGLPDSLSAGGTALHDVTLAALESGQELWTQDAITTVVVITDGQNEDSDGLTLEQLTESIQQGADPERPIGVTAVAFGPDADIETLQSIVESAQGWGLAQTVDARDATALEELLVATISARPQAFTAPDEGGDAAEGGEDDGS